MKKLIILMCLIILLFSGIAYADIIILVPKILPSISFADQDNPTQEEIAALGLYNNRILNFAPIKNWIEKNIVFTGVYEELINYRKASIWIKNGNQYMLFVLKTTRIFNPKPNPVAILGGLNALHSQKDLDFTSTNNVEQWLKDNGYTRPEAAE